MERDFLAAIGNQQAGNGIREESGTRSGPRFARPAALGFSICSRTDPCSSSAEMRHGRNSGLSLSLSLPPLDPQARARVSEAAEFLLAPGLPRALDSAV
jgi:hypothetical protein